MKCFEKQTLVMLGLALSHFLPLVMEVMHLSDIVQRTVRN